MESFLSRRKEILDFSQRMWPQMELRSAYFQDLLWEFGGQGTLWSTHEFFLSPEAQYRNCGGCLSTQSCQKKFLRYWLTLIKPHLMPLSDPLVLLVGTHKMMLFLSQ